MKMRATDIILKSVRMIKRYLAIQDDEKLQECACHVVKHSFNDAPILGIDIDGTIDESSDFFKILSKTWPGKVYIVTARDDAEKAKQYVDSFDIYYDDIYAIGKLDKAETISRIGIDVFFDDQDECIKNISDDVTVMKIRNDGNSKSGKWLYSNNTGINIDR